MVTARKMFEELGYNTPAINPDNLIVYFAGFMRHRQEITFGLKTKEVRIDVRYARPELIKAIYKQCEELGWL